MEYKYIKDTVRHVVQLLVEQRYDELYQNDFEKRVDQSGYLYAIDMYRLMLTMPPNEAFDKIEML